MIRVFVYGTLMKNCCNHDYYLQGQKYLGLGILPGYALYNLGSFPGIIPDEGERVLGEVYEVEQQCLEQLDLLEDNGHLYIRQATEVWLDQIKIEAEVYVWNGKVRKKNKIEFYHQPWSEKIKPEVSINE